VSTQVGTQVDAQEVKPWGKGKTAVVFVIAFAVAVTYYVFLDWVMMVPVQNLPFPYK